MLHTGMLWFASTKDNMTPEQKIVEAVDYYKKKYGRTPDLCLVHPSMLEGGRQIEIPALRAGASVSSLTVRPYKPVLPGHIWIGIEDKG